MFTCKCGQKFKLRRHLIEHIGLLNPHWPRSTPQDEHKDNTVPYPPTE
jgi:hypothetical protein